MLLWPIQIFLTDWELGQLCPHLSDLRFSGNATKVTESDSVRASVAVRRKREESGRKKRGFKNSLKQGGCLLSIPRTYCQCRLMQNYSNRSKITSNSWYLPCLNKTIQFQDETLFYHDWSLVRNWNGAYKTRVAERIEITDNEQASFSFSMTVAYSDSLPTLCVVHGRAKPVLQTTHK